MWVCPLCTAAGVTVGDLEAREWEVEREEDARVEAFPSAARRRRIAQAKALEGRLIVQRYSRSKGGEEKQRWGTLHFRRGNVHPLYLRAVFQDGTHEDMTTRKVTAGKFITLLPEGAKLPKVRGSKVSHVSVASVLPDEWDVCTGPGVTAALGMLMPGKRYDTASSRLANEIKRSREDACNLQWVSTYDSEVEVLLEAVDFSSVASVLDPFSGAGTVASVVGRHMKVPVITNDIHSVWDQVMFKEDALQPGFYRRHPATAIITSPWFAILDFAVALAVLHVPVVAMHVPGHWLTSAPLPRQHYLRSLQAQGRLHLIMGLPRSPMGHRCMWLLVFATQQLKEQMVRPSHMQQGEFTLSWVLHEEHKVGAAETTSPSVEVVVSTARFSWL